MWLDIISSESNVSPVFSKNIERLKPFLLWKALCMHDQHLPQQMERRISEHVTAAKAI